MRQFAIGVLFLAVTTVMLPAQEAGQTSWILGIAGMSGPSTSVLNPAAQSALSSLSTLVLARIQNLEQRFIPEEENRMRREKQRLAEIYSAGAEAATLRDKRDSVALSSSPSQKRAAEGRKLGSDYRKQAKDPKPPDGEKAGEPGITIKISLWPGHASGEFVNDAKDPAFVCKKEKLDYLVRWEIQEIDGFFRIRMEGWNAVLGRSDFFHTAYGPSDNIASVADELAYAVILASVSRPSALVTFNAEPADTTVFVDGRQMAPGENSFRAYEERDYEITAEAPGYTQEITTIRPEFGKNTELAIELEPFDESHVVIFTEPEGASLYLDGIWAGTTPFTFPLQGIPRVVLLKHPGYEDLFEVVNPGEHAEISLALEKIGEGTSTTLTRKKEKFYNALGLLVVSLPVSIVSYGVYLQSYMLYLEDPGNSDFSRRNDISLGCFAAAAGVSGAFFVHAAIRLVQYVKSAR